MSYTVDDISKKEKESKFEQSFLENNIWIIDNVFANVKYSEKGKGDAGSESASPEDKAKQCNLNTTAENCVSTRTGQNGFKQNRQATQDSQ